MKVEYRHLSRLEQQQLLSGIATSCVTRAAGRGRAERLISVTRANGATRFHHPDRQRLRR